MFRAGFLYNLLMTKDITERFIEINKRFVGDKERLSKFPPKAVEMYEQFAKGMCFCGEELIVKSFTKTGSGADWLFKCGHKLTAISLEETNSQNSPHGDKHYRSELESGRQSEVNVQSAGEKQGKEESELAVVKLLCHMHKKDLQQFSQPETDSHIDVIGEDGEGNKIFFQVTQLYDQEFWHKLGKHEKASIELKNKATQLIEGAINRKLNYPKDLRKNLVLVIDSGVGLLKVDIDAGYFRDMRAKSYFSEIWLVGRTAGLTIKL
jgi:hypothetical protein